MIPDGFEAYASKNVNALNFVPIAFLGPKKSISTYSPRQLWDSDQYDGTNPSISAKIGLAEYTNANFASEDTIFTENNLDDWSPLNNKHYFPYPRQADMIVLDESLNRIGMNGYVIYRKYFEKIGGGQIIRHFATASRLYEHLLDDPEPSIQGFDDRCYKDYADLLIPRAVGYSAALLDYFFRGQMETNAFEKKDNNGNITELSVNMLNTTTDETMNNGTFVLSYRYLRSGWPGFVYNTTAPLPSGEIAFKGSKQLSFVLSNPIPADATDKQYTLVYSGTLGMETGAVVGKVVTVTPDAIAITAPERFVYALADDGLSNKSFNKLRMRLRDNDQTIAMTGGSATATARYKIHLNHTDDLANEPPDGFERSETFTTVASLPVAVALDAVTPVELEFDFTANPIPFGVTDLTLEVAYKQGDTLIAIGTKDLNEPQYVGVWNAHDRFLIDRDLNPSDTVHDWQLLTQAEIMDDPALVERLDTDGGGLIDEIVDPVDVDVDVAFVGAPEEVLPENYQASYSHIPAGRFGRLAFIADQSPVFALFHDRYTSSLPDSSTTGDYLKFDGIGRYFFPGVTNQQAGETYYYTPIYLFRGIKNHFNFTSVGLFPKPGTRTEEGMAIKEADWPAPASTAPVPATTIKP